MLKGFDNECSSLHRDMKTFSDSDFLPSQEMCIPQPEEVETVYPDDGGTDIRILSKAMDTKRQKRHHHSIMVASID
jgi:hypothetical protein